MQIELHLPQFNNKRALIITTGEYDAKIYLASNGFIDELDLIYISKPQYTDREEFFEKKNEMGVYGSGSVNEPQKLYMRKKFLGALKKELHEIFSKDAGIDSLYLFSPRYMEYSIEKELSKNLKNMIKFEEFGNYFSAHPFKLLNIIKKKKEESCGKSVPINPKARKLLDKPSE